MESIISQRIRLIAENYGLSISSLSKKIGIAQQTLNRQVVGENTMSFKTIETILCCFPDISAEWLLRGEGNMLKSFTPSHAPSSTKELTIYIDENGFLKAK